MGNCFAIIGCSSHGEQLVTATREGDVSEVRKILATNPRLARYISFGLQVAPVHFASARGHVEILSLLLEHGADVDSKNHVGQTALMHACYFGHWQTVQLLLMHQANVGMCDLVTGRMPLHFAAAEGHTQCARLVLADYVPSDWQVVGYRGNKKAEMELRNMVNQKAECEITALHLAALHSHIETVQFLLDVGADVNAKTGQDGMDFGVMGRGMKLGAASTPLHYAACTGNLSCVQLLLSRGASRTHANDNGWTAQNVAKMWKWHNLEEILAPDAEFSLQESPPSRLLALPLFSIMSIARDSIKENQKKEDSENGAESCGVCFDRITAVTSSECGHCLCVQCALDLCSTGSLQTGVSDVQTGAIPCPFCRKGILNFSKKQM